MDKIDEVAMDAAASADGDDEVLKSGSVLVLQSGIKVRIKQSPPFVITQAVSKIKPPTVPIWHNPDKERDEPNPTDPNYRQELLTYYNTTGEALINVLLLFGLEVVEIPEGIPAVADNSWVEDLEFLGIEVPRDKPRIRQLLWFKTVAFANDEDALLVSKSLMKLQGLSEEDVAKAADFFRSGEGRRPDPGGAAKASRANRNNVQPTRPRASAGSRRARRS